MNFDKLSDRAVSKEAVINKRFVIEFTLMFIVFIIFMTAALTGSYIIESTMVIIGLLSATSYIKANKRMDYALKNQMILDEIVHYGDISWVEKNSIHSYENIEPETIGVKEKDGIHVYLAYEDGKKFAYYVSKVPFQEEIKTSIQVDTKYGAVDVIGTSMTTKIIDIIMDPETGESIPIKMVLMSPKIALDQTLDMIDLPIQAAVIEPIISEIFVEDRPTKKFDIIAIKCHNCGAPLNVDIMKQSNVLGNYITCEFCGNDNGIRKSRQDRVKGKPALSGHYELRLSDHRSRQPCHHG